MRNQPDHVRAAADCDRYPPWVPRKRQLEAPYAFLHDNGDRLAQAISADFGHRSRREMQLIELFPGIRVVCQSRLNGAWLSSPPYVQRFARMSSLLLR